MSNMTKYYLFHSSRKVRGKNKQIVFYLDDDEITSNQVQSKVKEYDGDFGFGSYGNASWKLKSITVHSSWLRFDREITQEELEILAEETNYYSRSRTPDLQLCHMELGKPSWCTSSGGKIERTHSDRLRELREKYGE